MPTKVSTTIRRRRSQESGGVRRSQEEEEEEEKGRKNRIGEVRETSRGEEWGAQLF